MEEQLIERYNALKAALAVSLVQIDDELVRCSQLVQDAGELSAESLLLERAAHLALDVITAQVSGELRIEGVESGRKQRSETQITSELPNNIDYQMARNAYDKARYDSSVCQSLVNSMRDRVKAIIKAGDLIQAGYITTNAAVYREKFSKA